jgi:tetratricopeptide (TPR) repeat protein
MRENSDQLMARARARFAAGDNYGTVHVLAELETAGHAYADAHQLRGVALALLGHTDRALEAFDAALALNPGYVEALIHRGLVLGDLGRSEEANACFAQAAEANAPQAGFPRQVAARLANQHAELGEAYAEAGALDRAIEQYRAALELGPAFHDLRYRLGRHLLAAGRALEAREELERVVAAEPDLLPARIALGLVRYLSGDADGAREIWSDCGDAGKGDARVSALLAMVERVPQ